MADGPDRDEKTEDATPKRREEARSKGQVAFSSEIVVVAMLATALATLMFLGGDIAGSVGALVQRYVKLMGAVGAEELALEDASAALTDALRSVAPTVMIVVLPMLFVGLLAGFGQVGVHLASKALEVDGSKLDPVRGFRRLFDMRSWVRTLLGGLKIGLVATTVLVVMAFMVPRTGGLVDAGVGPLIAAIGTILLRATIAALAVLLALAMIDLIYQRIQHTKDLRMTKKEVRDEARNAEGDPLVKSRIRQVQRELASRRMMEDVPKATVIVTNPTHFAVALRYDEESQSAPVVVAKGLDEVALAIRALATEHGVVVYEEPPLARALHRACEIGDSVPAELFEAVARVLAYVYRIQGRTPVSV